jgi:hypothetical protein
MSLGVLAENYTRGMWQNDDIITATICQAEIRPSRTYPDKPRRRLATLPPSSRSIETPSRQRARKGKPPSNGTKLSRTAPAILAFTSTSRLRPAMCVLRVPLGTRSTKSGRIIRVRPRALYHGLQQSRAEQSSVAFPPSNGLDGASKASSHKPCAPSNCRAHVTSVSLKPTYKLWPWPPPSACAASRIWRPDDFTNRIIGRDASLPALVAFAFSYINTTGQPRLGCPAIFLRPARRFSG